MFCNRIRGIVNDLDKDYGAKIEFLQLDATLPVNTKVVQANGLGSHGALAKDPSGHVIWKVPGHRMEREDLLKGVRAILTCPR